MRWFSSAILHCMYQTTKSLPKLRLLCNIPLHVKDWEELYQAGLVPMLAWETSERYLSKEDTLRTLLQEAKSRLNLHQSKGSRGVN
ncbi:hypothetical protein L3X38_039442 [Prunus dulcis]|uniref:Uncharacterized protein n=1 Tax=Prunus dulcis TaxID=3755 RepID=A0AAD4YSK6_PRUDU|nr:hypothetical protein L3X38_039442 [Prunus dulcis]